MKPIEELTFTDDYMFGYVMRNEEICKGLLERLLNIKIQNSLHDDLPTRTRYYQSMMDIDLLLKGKQYSELKESFVIFVCQEDFFQENLPCYTFSNLCHEKLSLELGDKTQKIIFNAAAFHQEKDVERKSILEYIKNKKSTSDFTQKIHQIVERTKANQAFRGEYMAWGLAEQDAEKRGYKAGIAQGAEQAKIETAQNLLAMHLSLDNIAKATGLSMETLKKLATGENAPNG